MKMLSLVIFLALSLSVACKSKDDKGSNPSSGQPPAIGEAESDIEILPENLQRQNQGVSQGNGMRSYVTLASFEVDVPEQYEIHDYGNVVHVAHTEKVNKGPKAEVYFRIVSDEQTLAQAADSSKLLLFLQSEFPDRQWVRAEFEDALGWKTEWISNGSMRAEYYILTYNNQLLNFSVVATQDSNEYEQTARIPESARFDTQGPKILDVYYDKVVEAGSTWRLYVEMEDNLSGIAERLPLNSQAQFVLAGPLELKGRRERNGRSVLSLENLSIFHYQDNWYYVEVDIPETVEGYFYTEKLAFADKSGNLSVTRNVFVPEDFLGADFHWIERVAFHVNGKNIDEPRRESHRYPRINRQLSAVVIPEQVIAGEKMQIRFSLTGGLEMYSNVGVKIELERTGYEIGSKKDFVLLFPQVERDSVEDSYSATAEVPANWPSGEFRVENFSISGGPDFRYRVHRFDAKSSGKPGQRKFEYYSFNNKNGRALSTIEEPFDIQIVNPVNVAGDVEAPELMAIDFNGGDTAIHPGDRVRILLKLADSSGVQLTNSNFEIGRRRQCFRIGWTSGIKNFVIAGQVPIEFEINNDWPCDGLRSVGGDWYESNYIVPHTVRPGKYYLRSIELSDRLGNSAKYYTSSSATHFKRDYYDRNDTLIGSITGFRTRPLPELSKVEFSVEEELPPGVVPSQLEKRNRKRLPSLRTNWEPQPESLPIVEGFPSSGLNTKELAIKDLQGKFSQGCSEKSDFELVIVGHQLEILRRYYGDEGCRSEDLIMTIEFQFSLVNLGYIWPAEKVLLLKLEPTQLEFQFTPYTEEVVRGLRGRFTEYEWEISKPTGLEYPRGEDLMKPDRGFYMLIARESDSSSEFVYDLDIPVHSYANLLDQGKFTWNWPTRNSFLDNLAERLFGEGPGGYKKRSMPDSGLLYRLDKETSK